MYRTRLAAGIVLLLAAPPAAPQDEVPTFGEAVEVSVVNLSVYVTRGGKPVTDLSREVFEDGKMVAYEMVVAMTPSARRLAVAARDDVGQTMAAVKREFKLVDG